MTLLRLNIAIGVIAACGVAFFFLVAAGVNADSLAIAFVSIILIAAWFDVRFLIVGWFLAAPYFSLEGAPNIASNITHNILVPFILLLVLLRAVMAKRKLRLGKEDVVLLLFVAYALVSSFIATKGRYEDVRQIYLIYLVPFFLYLIIKNSEINERLIRAMAIASIFHVVVLFLMGVYESQTGLSFYTNVLKWADVGRGRIAGPFGSPIIYGDFIPIIFLNIFLAYKFGLLPRYVVWISAALSTVMILLTFTRSVWLGAFLAFVYLVYTTSEDAGAKLLRIAMFVTVAGVVAGIAIFSSREVAGRIGEQENANFRIVMAQVGINMFLDKPVVGWGAGTYDDYSDRYLFDALGVYITKDTSHVTLLTIMAELGILGAALFLGFIFLSVRHKGIGMADLPYDDRIIVAVNAAGIITFAINAFLIDMRFYSIAYSWFFMNLAFIHTMYYESTLARMTRHD
jgi:O-antigen ligase